MVMYMATLHFLMVNLRSQNGFGEIVGNYYGSAVSGLNFNENIFQLHVSTSFTGLPISIFEAYPFLPEKIHYY